MAVTIKYLAEQLGVSPSVVSSVINDKAYCRVSDKRRKEILEKARKLNCCPNSAAQTLKSGRSRMIGILMPAPMISCYARMVTYLQQQLQKKGLMSLYYFWHDARELKQIRNAYGKLLSHGVDGMIVWNTSELPEDREIPVVMYYPDEQYTGDSVQMDEEILAQEVAKYLKQRGLSSIGAMLAPHDYAKSAAFRKYCGLIPEHTIFSLGDDRVLGEKIFRQYLEMPNPPRIWFFSNYEALQSFVQTAFEQHFPLEQNFEAVCFEDIPCILPLPVHVVNFHAFREKTTEKLIETLLWRLDHPGEASRDVRLPVKLNAGTSMNVPVPASSSAVNGDDLYCNPLPLPDYPEGFFSPSRHGRVDSESDFMGPPRDFRELADPDVICADGVWYVLPSCRQAYVSRDLRNWTYEPIRFADPAEKLGYAPSIVRCGKRFLLTHSVQDFSPAKLFEAESPLGPYRLLGSVTMRDGSAPDPHYLDPAFFCDEDGRLYLYWGIGGAGSGVYGVELDAENPIHAVTDPVKVLDFDPDNLFERYGEYNEHPDLSYIEGVSMLKHEGRYYLQYSFNGTHFRHYGLGMAVGDSPLGFFEKQTVPMAYSPHGLVCGSGHGAMAKGPDGAVWEFYTCLIRGVHKYERRIAMDRVHFEVDGTVRIRVSANPQSLSRGNTAQLPVSVNKPVCGSSCAPGHYAAFANDDCTHTCWVPAAEDTAPYLEIDLRAVFELGAMRIMWSEPDLNYRQGCVPEPVRFRVDFRDENGKILDASYDGSRNTEDHLIEFVTLPAVKARFARLTLLQGNMRHGVTQWTLFGILRKNRSQI